MKRATICLLAWALTGIVWADGNVASDLNLVGVIGGETNPKEAIAVIKDGGRTLFLQMGDPVRSGGSQFKITKIAGKAVTISNPHQGDLTVIVRAQENGGSAESVLESYANSEFSVEDEEEEESGDSETASSSILTSDVPDGAVSLPTGAEIPGDNSNRALKRRIRAADAAEALNQLKILQGDPPSGEGEMILKASPETN